MTATTPESEAPQPSAPSLAALLATYRPPRIESLPRRLNRPSAVESQRD